MFALDKYLLNKRIDLSKDEYDKVYSFFYDCYDIDTDTITDEASLSEFISVVGKLIKYLNEFDDRYELDGNIVTINVSPYNSNVTGYAFARYIQDKKLEDLCIEFKPDEYHDGFFLIKINASNFVKIYEMFVKDNAYDTYFWSLMFSLAEKEARYIVDKLDIEVTTSEFDDIVRSVINDDDLSYSAGILEYNENKIISKLKEKFGIEE